MRHPTPLVDPANRIALFTNAKCGGTSIKVWFLINLGLDNMPPLAMATTFGWRFTRTWLHKTRFYRNPLTELTNSKVRRLVKDYGKHVSQPVIDQTELDGFTRILISRDPYKRIASAYIDKFCGADRDRDFVQEVIHSHGQDGAISFNGLLDYLRDTEEQQQNPHWRRQTYVLEGRDVDHIVPLENLNEGLKNLPELPERTDFSPLEKKRQTNRYAEPGDWSDEDVPALSNQAILAKKQHKGRFPAHDDLLTPETRRRIRELYRADFDYLPYTPD